MTWLNEYEIEGLQRQFDKDEFPNLRAGSESLKRLMDWTNGCSDGWPFWKLPAKAAGALMEALHGAREKRRSLLNDLTDAELKKLMSPIEKFLKTKNANPALLYPPPAPKAPPIVPAEITGKIVMDGVESEFRMGADAESLYTQWGAPIPELGRRVVLLARVAEVFRTFAAEELCVECVARTASENDPFGQERLCDECISAGSCAASCSPDDEEFMTEPPYGVCSECGTDWKKWDGQDWELFRKNNRKDTTPEEAPDVD